ncbi:NADH:ubiquinone oxidoreductase subunit 5 (chain L)/Multisubunit Na+/H+ antiporter, MnhA subunit [Palleronia salina]|uniref:NADH:ubiquinone oxidoreductase subunit 5 (Chain L)/Multisubunit Na+/H+ antiporter, MnhA subunit n=1 Tax=Palleronia salina TaxID=313368 RepID=A0A1M6BCZ8_9RHOB|nr:proton-conducting transporter membrane subunit [Palleronia salina]SHI46612.1 NADH:ubiquinone oxidoreductase subunit 5 (chain L)/Multisubunit Na+/H+ antiporter, MnhA subunit [Palleronia salina]
MIWSLAYLPALAGQAIWALGGPRGRVATLALGAAAVTLALAVAVGGRTGAFAWSDAIALQAALPPLAQAVAILVPAVLGPIILFAASHEDAAGLPRLLGLMLVFTGGMELIVIAADLVTLLIGWEIVGACSWALIGHKWRQQAPGLSANFAFVMTRAGDLGLFLAVMATFAGAGRVGYDALGALDGWAQALAAFGLLLAAASKAGQVPFAPWLFRAMDGPTPVSALLHSATMVAAGVYILARLHPQLSGAPGFAATAMVVGLGTAILGGAVALRQGHAKKLLAGSTSAQMGLMIATVGAGYPVVAVLHLIVHATTKAALFCAAGLAQGVTGSFDLKDMRLGRRVPVAAALAGVAALSLAAVPSLAGGWSKEEMVKAVEHAGPFWTAAMVIAGGLGAAYATRFWVAAFGPGDDDAPAVPRGEIGALSALALATLALSALWLPAVHDPVASWFGIALPEGSILGQVASLTAVAIGVLAGLRLARTGLEAQSRDWLGLPELYQRGVIEPFHALANTFARVDDAIVDLIPRGVAGIGFAAAGRLSRADDDAIDGLAPVAARRVGRGAVALAVRSTEALASLGAGIGERLSDLIPTASGRLTGMAGADLRGLQTGLAHHYYTILTVGIALAVGLMNFGG